MPRTKLDQRNQRFDKLIVLIWGTLSAREIKVNDFADAVGIAKTTLYSRKRRPEDFSVRELSRIGRYLNIPIEELRQCIMY